MIIATTETIAGHRVVNTLGQAFGVVVRRRGIGGNFMAGLRSIVGGEIHGTGKTVEVFYNATSGERQYVSPDSDRR